MQSSFDKRQLTPRTTTRPLAKRCADFTTPTLRYIQYRKIYDDVSEYPAAHAHKLYGQYMLPPMKRFNDAFGSICSKMMKFATNRSRCPVTQVTVCFFNIYKKFNIKPEN